MGIRFPPSLKAVLFLPFKIQTFFQPIVRSNNWLMTSDPDSHLRKAPLRRRVLGSLLSAFAGWLSINVITFGLAARDPEWLRWLGLSAGVSAVFIFATWRFCRSIFPFRCIPGFGAGMSALRNVEWGENVEWGSNLNI